MVVGERLDIFLGGSDMTLLDLDGDSGAFGGAGPADGGGAAETIEPLRDGGAAAAGVVSIDPLRADSVF